MKNKKKHPSIKLGELLVEFTTKNKSNEKILVYSVTNDRGFTVSTEYFSKEVFSKNLSTYKIVQKGDFAYNPSRINVGSVDYFKSDDKGLISPLYVTFKTKDSLNPLYLKYFLKSDVGKMHIRNNTSGSVRDSLSFKNLSKIEIPLPPIEEQDELIKNFEETDSLKRKRQISLVYIQEYIKSLFLSMFGDLYTNEKNWEFTTLGKYISVLTDYHANGSYQTLKKHVTLLSEPDYALMVRTTDLENNNFIEDVKYINQHAYDFLDKSKVYGGEIIVNKIGSAGKVYLMPNLNKPVSLGMNAFLIRFNELTNAEFIYHVLTSDYGEKIIQKQVKGSVTKTIRKDAIRALKIPVIPFDLQNKFIEMVRSTELLKKKMLKQEEYMVTQFQSLMQKSFNQSNYDQA